MRHVNGYVPKKSFDLIILDLALPDGSGLELLPKLVLPDNPLIPAIIFSAYETNLEVRQAVAAALVKS